MLHRVVEHALDLPVEQVDLPDVDGPHPILLQPSQAVEPALAAEAVHRGVARGQLVQLVDDEPGDDDLSGEERTLGELDDPPVDEGFLAHEEAGPGPALLVGLPEQDEVVRHRARGGRPQVSQQEHDERDSERRDEGSASDHSGGDRQASEDRQHEHAEHEAQQEPDAGDQHLARIALPYARLQEQRQHEHRHSCAHNDVGQPSGLVQDGERAHPYDQQSKCRTQIVHSPPRVAVCGADGME